ncbi:MAG: OmpA family protein, partial [Crocinitomicaceae bacterium]
HQKFEELFHIKNNDINTKFWETHCTVTRDGLQMYFVSSRPGGYGGRDIYRIVKLPNGNWSEPINLGPEINTPYDEDSPFIAVDNKTLYYSSNGKTSMGGFDIFRTIRDENDVWSPPMNLGFPINSTGDDVFYTTTADGLRGYLSSYRKGGMGEKDIYEIENDYLGIKSISLLKGEFRMTDGSPVGDDVIALLTCDNCNDETQVDVDLRIKSGSFFSALDRCKDYTLKLYSDSGQRLLKTEKFTTLCNDQNETIEKIVYIPNYTLAGTVADDKTLEWIEGARITMNETGSKEIIAEFNSDSLGAFVSNYLENKKLGDEISLEFHISKKDYLTQTFKFDTLLGKFGHIQLDYILTKDEAGIDLAKVLHLNPIYFDLDKSNIRPDAALELDKIVVIMNENPEMKIELGSHTDCRASFSYNMKLSDRRAKSSAKYIRERITNPERIYGKGYGESKLVNDCGCEGDVVSDCSEEEHQLNRRTEFVIVK